MSRYACRTCGTPTDGLAATCGAVACVRVDLAATRVIAAKLGRVDAYRLEIRKALRAADAAADESEELT